MDIVLIIIFIISLVMFPLSAVDKNSKMVKTFGKTSEPYFVDISADFRHIGRLRDDSSICCTSVNNVHVNIG